MAAIKCILGVPKTAACLKDSDLALNAPKLLRDGSFQSSLDNLEVDLKNSEFYHQGDPTHILISKWV